MKGLMESSNSIFSQCKSDYTLYPLNKVLTESPFFQPGCIIDPAK